LHRTVGTFMHRQRDDQERPGATRTRCRSCQRRFGRTSFDNVEHIRKITPGCGQNKGLSDNPCKLDERWKSTAVEWLSSACRAAIERLSRRQGGDVIQSVDRALRVLAALSGARRMSLGEIAARLVRQD
jgi:IclR helix-turn-helix domain.